MVSFDAPLHFVVGMVLEQLFWVLAPASLQAEELARVPVSLLAEASVLLSVGVLVPASVWVVVPPSLSVVGQTAFAV